MRRLRLGAPLLAACLLPGAAAAQSDPIESLNGPPYAPISLSADDLGTWDVELSGRTPLGARVTVRGVETNTIGCNGGCVVTRVAGELANATRRNGGGTAWWQSYDASSDIVLKQTGIPETASASSSQVVVHPVTPRPSTPVAPGVPGSRTSVEYVGTDRRIVTVYRPQPDGTEAPVTRVVCTRRQ